MLPLYHVITNKYNWLSVHLYYEKPFEELLKKGVYEFINQYSLKNPGLIESYFFIRYMEKGPHIRLRLKGNTNTLEKKVKADIRTFFTNYFSEFPSNRLNQNYITTSDWYPNNSIQFIEYQPEIERYGGEFAISVAENHFNLSSETILAIINSSENFTYSNAISTAIGLHLAMYHAMGLSAPQIIELTHYFIKHYHKDKYDQNVSTYRKLFEKQKIEITHYVSTLWKSLMDTKSELLVTWIEGNEKALNELLELNKQNKLILPKCDFNYTYIRNNPKFCFDIFHTELWHMLDSYIHMTNNRLGITNPDEPYLQYILNQTLKSIQNEKKS